jgi:hypothetical protein
MVARNDAASASIHEPAVYSRGVLPTDPPRGACSRGCLLDFKDDPERILAPGYKPSM